jgi:hypothetical protein
MGVVVSIFRVADCWNDSWELCAKELILEVARLPAALSRERWKDLSGADREHILATMHRLRIIGDMCRVALL